MYWSLVLFILILALDFRVFFGGNLGNPVEIPLTRWKIRGVKRVKLKAYIQLQRETTWSSC